MGIISKKILNEISDNNLGGVISSAPKINKNVINNELIFKHTDIKPVSKSSTKPVSKSTIKFVTKPVSKSTTKSVSKSTNKSTIKPVSKSATKPLAVKVKWLIKETERVKKAELQVGNYGNFLDFGRLDWYNNSCFADSILILLLFPMFNGKISDFITENLLEKPMLLKESIEKEHYKKYICNTNTFEKSIEIINSIYTTFVDLYNQPFVALE